MFHHKESGAKGNGTPMGESKRRGFLPFLRSFVSSEPIRGGGPCVVLCAVLMGLLSHAFLSWAEEAVPPCAPVRLLPAYADRAAWAAVAKANDVPIPAVVGRAEAFVPRPMPPFPRERFLDFRKKGERWAFEAANNARWARLFVFAYAELLEGKGRFLTPLSETLSALCDSPTWVLSAHDVSLANLEGRTVGIDLASAHRAWQVAEIVAAFGEALPEAVREKAIATVRARAVEPYLRMVRGGKYAWWANAGNNWNPVCHAGVVGATLALPGTTAEERAAIVGAAREKVRRYLRGFSSDGWTAEGVGYWNYGFGNFAALAELVRRATAGREDWLLWPEAKAPALAVPTLRLSGQVYPAVADCAADMAADPRLSAFLAYRLGAASPVAFVPDGTLPFPHAFAFVRPKAEASVGTLPPHTWLPQAQLLVGRAPGMAFFASGGSNGGSHGHNDVGVFGVALDGMPVLADLGGESYTAKTFSSARYESPLINSFGHSVPRPAGALQVSGGKTEAKVLAATFEPEGRIRLLLDLAPAYRVEGLRTLTREFVWEPAVPALTVTDRFAFDKPQTFETALTGWGRTLGVSGDRFRIAFGGHALEAKISASGAWTMREEAIPGERMIERPCAWMDWSLPEDGIPANAPGKAFAQLPARRFGLALESAAQEGFVSVRLSPEAAR